MRAFVPIVVIACGGSEPAAPDAAPTPDASDDAATTVQCGSGTVEIDGTCLPAARHYELRIEETELGANGRTRRRILALGTEPDGTAVFERVIIGVDRASAGTLDDSFLTLGAHGATTLFTPCLASDPDCLGDANLLLALASAPQEILATTAITLIPATTVSTIAPCIDQARRFHVDHDRNMQEAEEGAWFISHQFSNDVSLELTPIADDNLGRATFEFNSIQLGVPLSPGIFENARRTSSQVPDHPEMQVLAGRGCNQIDGRFQIHTYTRETQTSDFELLLSFEQFCDADPKPLEGCVRYTP
jgi:hypothetical protein